MKDQNPSKGVDETDVKVNVDFIRALVHATPSAFAIWIAKPETRPVLQEFVVDGMTAISTAVMFAMNEKSPQDRQVRIGKLRALAKACLEAGIDLNASNQDGTQPVDIIQRKMAEPGSCEASQIREIVRILQGQVQAAQRTGGTESHQKGAIVLGGAYITGGVTRTNPDRDHPSNLVGPL